MRNKLFKSGTPAQREEIIKKLESPDYPDIEPAFHKQQLKRALLNAAKSRERDGFRFPNPVRIAIPTVAIAVVALLAAWGAGLFSGEQTVMTPTSTLASGSQISMQAPELEIIEPMDNATFDSSYVKVQGKTYPNAVVSINDSVTISDDYGAFYAYLDLDNGFNVIQITASDESGNQSSTTIVANVDEGVQSDEIY
jgi:hypothetical protein